MLVELVVENIAVLERCVLPLGPGFTVLTGETGAGKSLLVDAIGLALGERADSALVRTGASRGTVALTADLSDSPEVRDACAERGIELDEGVLYLQREVSSEGRSVCRIGGRLAPVGQLKQLGDLMVDLHGQHDHQSLLRPETHLEHLDGWIGLPCQEAKSVVLDRFRAVEELRKRLAALQTGQREREQRIDLLRYQVDEIESFGPQLGEGEQLEALVKRLQNAEKIASLLASTLTALSGDEASALDHLGSGIKDAESAASLDPRLEEPLEAMRSAYYTLQDSASDFRRFAEEVEASPAALDEAVQRLDGLKRLKRKYGDDEQAILDFAQHAAEELELLTNAESNAEELQAELAVADRRLVDACKALSDLRKSHASRFTDHVESELRGLALEKAVFGMEFTPKTPDGDGADWAEFSFSANAGESPRPLSRIASGGEVSRVMLAVKVVLAGKGGVPTLIFDEVDTGLSGRAAAKVATKLEQLGQHYQVVVISHLPQIAARATVHFRIEKVERGGRVSTQVRALDPDERVHEVARLLAGESVGQSALANARELLAGSS